MTIIFTPVLAYIVPIYRDENDPLKHQKKLVARWHITAFGTGDASGGGAIQQVSFASIPQLFPHNLFTWDYVTVECSAAVTYAWAKLTPAERSSGTTSTTIMISGLGVVAGVPVDRILPSTALFKYGLASAGMWLEAQNVNTVTYEWGAGGKIYDERYME